MKIYDISQEVFGSVVFPGDPAPKKETLSSMKDGALYNLTAFSMCAHNGTHIDAPYHFIDGGKTVDELELSSTIGYAYVAEHEGELSAEDARRILERAELADPRARDRILIKGKMAVTLEAAKTFSRAGVRLVGNESQTVGPEESPMAVHLELLGSGVVLLEGIRLSGVPEGVYLLTAQPLNLGGSDGAPCRALLISFDE
jgi:arylformamidase